MSFITRLARCARGTSSAGVFTLAAVSVGIGAGYLGYHQHVSGNAIQNLVPEWQVAAVDGAEAPQICASAGESSCILTWSAGGAAAGAGVVFGGCAAATLGTGVVVPVCPAIAIVGGGLLGSIGGSIMGVLNCGGREQQVRIVEADVSDGAGALAYSRQDYKDAGVTLPDSEIDKLVAARRCSPQAYLNRANRVHPRCDLANVSACSGEYTCAQNQANYEYARECLARRRKRDYCFGNNIDQAHTRLFESLQRLLSNCAGAMRRTCHSQRADAAACTGGGTVAGVPVDGTGRGPVLVASTDLEGTVVASVPGGGLPMFTRCSHLLPQSGICLQIAWNIGSSIASGDWTWLSSDHAEITDCFEASREYIRCVLKESGRTLNSAPVFLLPNQMCYLETGSAELCELCFEANGTYENCSGGIQAGVPGETGPG